MAWLIFYKHPRDQKSCLTKNVTTLLMVRNPSIRPTTAKDVRLADPGTRQFWGIALPRFWQNRHGVRLTPDPTVHV